MLERDIAIGDVAVCPFSVGRLSHINCVWYSSGVCLRNLVFQTNFYTIVTRRTSPSDGR